MNFFGHAAIARWKSAEPAFVLGAMLPDFATMIGTRPPRARDARVGAGIAFHHATDDVFHDSVTFRRLQHAAFAELRARGVGRGGARAVAHVGVEILIDGELARDRLARDAYLDALREGEPLAEQLDWTDGHAGERYATLRDRLERYGVRAQPEASAIADRLARVLAPRPRLAIDDREQRLVEHWVDGARTAVASCASALLCELREGLSLAGPKS